MASLGCALDFEVHFAAYRTTLLRIIGSSDRDKARRQCRHRRDQGGVASFIIDRITEAQGILQTGGRGTLGVRHQDLVLMTDLINRKREQCFVLHKRRIVHKVEL